MSRHPDKTAIGNRIVDKHACSKSSCYKTPKFSQGSQSLTLDLSDSNNEPLSSPVTIQVKWQAVGNIVNLYIDAFNFTLPTQGYVYTVAGFLPSEIRPNDPLYQSFFVRTETLNVNAIVQVTNGGSLIFLPETGVYFDPNSYTINPITVTYFLNGSLCDYKPPKNIQASQGTSNSNLPTYQYSAANFLEVYDCSILNDKFVIWWPDNSVANSPNGRNHMNILARTGSITYDKCGRPIVNFDNDPILAMTTTVINPNVPTGEGIWMLEGSACINPTNPLNIVIVSTVGDSYWVDGVIAGDFQSQISLQTCWIAVSINGGQSWTQQLASDGVGIPYCVDDAARINFDKYGNLWLFAQHLTPDGLTLEYNTGQILGGRASLSLSIDGGNTFKLIQDVEVLEPIDPTTQGYNSYDYPASRIGGDGAGGYVCWNTISYQLANFDGSGFKFSNLMYVPIYNYNSYGDFTALQIPQTYSSSLTLAPNAQPSDLIVSDDGNISIYSTGANFCCLTPQNPMLFFNNPTGLLNFDLANGTTGNSFSGPYTTSKTNCGSYSTLTVIPYQPERGLVGRSFSLVYDEVRKRIYIGALDNIPLQPDANKLHNMVLYLLYSDDNGQTWSPPILISDTMKYSRGNLQMTQDKVTRNILFMWLDTRDNADQADVNTFIAIYGRKKLDKLPTLSSPSSKVPLKTVVEMPQRSLSSATPKSNQLNFRKWKKPLLTRK